MNEPDYDHLLWDLADRLSSKMTLHEIKKWLIDTGKHHNLASLSEDELTAAIESYYVDLAKLCDVKALIN
jgi:hypothetical protein